MRKLHTGLLLAKNLFRMAALDALPSVTEQRLTYRAFSLPDFEQIRRLSRELNACPIGLFQSILLRLVGTRLCLTAHNNNYEVAGFQLFYLNAKDFVEHTIHEGFIGVHPAFERQGIATTMRMLSATHFLNRGYRGISSRISKKNEASLISAKRAGFEIVEEYFDPEAGEICYYLVLKVVAPRQISGAASQGTDGGSSVR